MNKIKRYQQFVNESASVDVEYALKRIEEFNGGNLKWDKFISLIINDLGYRNSAHLVTDVVSDHLSAIKEDGKIPRDKDIIYELYDIIEGRI